MTGPRRPRAAAADRAATLRHRPVLDGLRGLAVALVVVYHLAPSALPGGFLGVDVFFVLSGYLISSLVLVEVERTGGFDLTGFYVRRVKRLLPALLLVVLAVGAYARWWASPDELGRLRSHSLWALGYLANWRFVTDGTTYTDVLYGESPLRHTWSLAIEEQFYLLFPLLVIAVAAAARWRPRRLRAWLGGISVVGALASAGWMIALWGDGADPSRGYFGTDTRAQTILVGVLAGCIQRGRPASAGSPWSSLAAVGAWAGAAVLGLGAVVASEDSAVLQHGGFLAVAVAAALVIAGAERAPVLGRVLRWRPLVALGLISYGVYLWHWPVLVLLDEGRTGLSGWSHTALLLAVTLAASLASYFAVERPIRVSRLPRARRAPVLGTAAASLVVVAGVLGAATVRPGSDPWVSSSGGRSDEVRAPATAEADAAGRPLRVLMFGDSVAHSIAGGIVDGAFQPWRPEQSSFDPARVELSSTARISCSYLSDRLFYGDRGPGVDLGEMCGGWRADLAAALAGREHDYVLVALALDASDQFADGEVVPLGSAGHQRLLDRFLDELRAIAAAHDAEVALVAPAPAGPPVADDPKEFERRARLFRTELLHYSERRGPVAVFDLFEQVCPAGDCSRPADGFEPGYRYDGLHYGPEGARWVADWLTEELEAVWPVAEPRS